MADELWNTLMKFHSEVAEPRIVGPLREQIAVKRLEERMASVDQKLDKMVVRSELLELKARIATLEEKVAELENEI